MASDEGSAIEIARSITSDFQNTAFEHTQEAATAYATETVWHYTSVPAFLSYLELDDGIEASGNVWKHSGSRSLWATSSRFLNDASEFEQGRESLDGAIRDYQSRSGLTEEQTQFLDDLLGCVAHADGLDVYCICFSALGDHLGQWRGYGDGGRGVAIGFDRQVLEHSLHGRGQWVVYDHVAQFTLAESLIDTAVGLLTSRPRGTLHWDNLRPVLRSRFEEVLPSIFLLFKDQHFSDEREYRVIYTDAFSRIGLSEPRCFRSRGSPLVPFVRLKCLPGDRDPFTSVCLGPGSQDDANLASLGLLLKQLGADGISASSSGIPFVPS